MKKHTTDCNLENCDVHVPPDMPLEITRAMDKKKCECDWCKEYGKLKKVMAKKTALTKQDKQFIWDTYTHYLEMDDDYCHLRCIIDGSWPSARNYLEAALKRVAEREAKEIAETGETSTPEYARATEQQSITECSCAKNITVKEFYISFLNGIKWVVNGIFNLVYKFGAGILYISGMPLWMIETSFRPQVVDTELKMYKFLKFIEQKLEKGI